MVKGTGLTGFRVNFGSMGAGDLGFLSHKDLLFRVSAGML